jgi:hypothetical protein
MGGCSKKENQPPSAVATPAPKVLPKVSQEDALKFARSLQKAVEDGDRSAANSLLNWKAICNTATESLGLSERQRTSFAYGAMQRTLSDYGLMANLVKQVVADGSYRMLRIREKDGHTTVLCRLICDSGFSYHEYLLCKDCGNVRAFDMFSYLSGELVSATLRRAAIPATQQLSKSLLQRLTTADTDFMKHSDKFTAMSDAIQAQRGDEALRLYASLPGSLQRDKGVLLLRHQAAMQVGEQQLMEAIDDFRRYHPNDVCLDVLLIDYYALHAEYDKALECLDRLDLAVGGDTFLNAKRADLAYAKHDVPAAYRLAEEAIEGNPDLIAAYWTLLDICSLEKDHARTLETLERIEAKFDTDLSGVHDDPSYAEFRSSPQGQGWLRKHPKQPAPANN